jgi:glyoxylase-like metal-dependent hydrolase (beta-lactamase superfamily II)
MHNRPLTADMTALQDRMEIPGLGVLPVNAFFLRSQQPLLVDTGLPHSRDSFLAAVAELVDLDDLRWIWLSHPDRDHTGALYELLDRLSELPDFTPFAAPDQAALEEMLRQFEPPTQRSAEVPVTV